MIKSIIYGSEPVSQCCGQTSKALLCFPAFARILNVIVQLQKSWCHVTLPDITTLSKVFVPATTCERCRLH